MAAVRAMVVVVVVGRQGRWLLLHPRSTADEYWLGVGLLFSKYS